jgi:hypothetical protein
MFLNRQERENLRDALEDALIQMAEKGDWRAARVVENPWLFRRVFARVKRDRSLVGDGSLLDQFERLVEFLLEHADAIIEVILKVIPLFIAEEKEHDI